MGELVLLRFCGKFRCGDRGIYHEGRHLVSDTDKRCCEMLLEHTQLCLQNPIRYGVLEADVHAQDTNMGLGRGKATIRERRYFG